MKLTVNTVKRAAASAIVLGALASATALAASTPASAATNGGKLEVCSEGNYASFVVFPDRPGYSTSPVDKGACRTFDVLGNSTSVESIEVRGINTVTGQSFLVNDLPAQIRPSKGGAVITQGSDTGKHWAMVPQI
ncbi:hypothetical protein [Amycolatopsis sp. NPDC059021]|uniref:hypothetical protein n=1 Tax=Amycolatopsis sp. NPDC059021 TaxID=3346704 RepID=UPI003671A3E8